MYDLEITIKWTRVILFITCFDVYVDRYFLSIANQRREFCEGSYDLRIICEERESVDSVARRAIAVAKWYHQDKGMLL